MTASPNNYENEHEIDDYYENDDLDNDDQYESVANFDELNDGRVKSRKPPKDLMKKPFLAPSSLGSPSLRSAMKPYKEAGTAGIPAHLIHKKNWTKEDIKKLPVDRKHQIYLILDGCKAKNEHEYRPTSSANAMTDLLRLTVKNNLIRADPSFQDCTVEWTLQQDEGRMSLAVTKSDGTVVPSRQLPSNAQHILRNAMQAMAYNVPIKLSPGNHDLSIGIKDWHKMGVDHGIRIADQFSSIKAKNLGISMRASGYNNFVKILVSIPEIVLKSVMLLFRPERLTLKRMFVKTSMHPLSKPLQLTATTNQQLRATNYTIDAMKTAEKTSLQKHAKNHEQDTAATVESALEVMESGKQMAKEALAEHAQAKTEAQLQRERLAKAEEKLNKVINNKAAHESTDKESTARHAEHKVSEPQHGNDYLDPHMNPHATEQDNAYGDPSTTHRQRLARSHTMPHRQPHQEHAVRGKHTGSLNRSRSNPNQRDGGYQH